MDLDHIARRGVLGALAAAGLLAAGAARAVGAAALSIADGGANPALSLDDLAARPQHEIRTSTEFTEGVVTFTGPLARDVIQAPAGATVAVMTAINDYAVEIPLEDFAKYDVILATHMNGKAMSRRDKGPIWVMYPLDAHAELQNPVYINRLIWQLSRISFK